MRLRPAHSGMSLPSSRYGPFVPISAPDARLSFPSHRSMPRAPQGFLADVRSEHGLCLSAGLDDYDPNRPDGTDLPCDGDPYPPRPGTPVGAERQVHTALPWDVSPLRTDWLLTPTISLLKSSVPLWTVIPNQDLPDLLGRIHQDLQHFLVLPLRRRLVGNDVRPVRQLLERPLCLRQEMGHRHDLRLPDRWASRMDISSWVGCDGRREASLAGGRSLWWLFRIDSFGDS